jgi:hypothetical protein
MILTNRDNAIKQLTEFVASDSEKVILLKGTHQYAKHSLILAMIAHYEEFKTGVFRSNSLQNVSMFLEQAGYKSALGKRFTSGKPYNLSGTSFYFDSLFTRSTWSKTPRELDFAILYPMDSFCESKKELKKELLEDILQRKRVKKVFIVTWTDLRHDYEWLNEYVDRTVIYDVKEEDPAYHQRVLDLMDK